MFERFTHRARKVVTCAQDEARRLRHDYIGTEHLLAGLLAEEDGIGAEALNHAGVELESVREKIESIAGKGEGEAEQPAPFTPRSKKVLELSLREALQLRHNYIGTEHILLGLLRENEGVAARILSDLGVDPDKVRGETVHRIGSEPQRATYQPPSPLQGERPLTAGSFVQKVLDQKPQDEPRPPRHREPGGEPRRGSQQGLELAAESASDLDDGRL